MCLKGAPWASEARQYTRQPQGAPWAQAVCDVPPPATMDFMRLWRTSHALRAAPFARRDSAAYNSLRPLTNCRGFHRCQQPN